MAPAQKTPQNLDESVRAINATLRREYPDYEQWTLPDFASRLNASAVRSIISAANPNGDWYIMIPQPIRDQYGDQAPRMFMNAVYSRMESLNMVDGNMDGVLYGSIVARLGLSNAQARSLVLDRPVEVVLTNGERISVTPAEAMLHQINRAINRPDPALTLAAGVSPRPDQPFMAPLGGVLALPNSLLDGLIAANPSLRTQLESLRGKAIVPVTPEVAYQAGRIAQLRGTNNVTDWSLRVDDPGRICPNVPVIENDVFNRTLNDVRLDEAWISGNVHNGCPGDLGNLPAPALRRSANDNSVNPARVSARVASAAF